MRFFANSAEPDQTPRHAASDQGLHCLHDVEKFAITLEINSHRKDP